MSDIVRKWLVYQLGIVFEPDAWNSDVGGVILSRILNRYGLISDDQLNSIVCQDELYESTLQYIQHIINSTLEIDLPKTAFQDVINGKRTTIAKLFYELFLALHDKNKMDIIASRKIKEVIKSENVESLNSTNSQVDALYKSDNSKFVGNLIKSRDAVCWYKEKMQNLLDKCKISRAEYAKYLKNKKPPINQAQKNIMRDTISLKSQYYEEKLLFSSAETLNLTYSDLLKEEKTAKNLECSEPDKKISQKIINSIKEKKRKNRDEKNAKLSSQKVAISQSWSNLFRKQEEHIKTILTEQLLKQSQYEEQMVTKLLEVREQTSVILNNKKKLMECIQKELDVNFYEKLLKDNRKDDAERLNYYVEKNRFLEIHKELYDLKLKRKAEKHYTICKNILEDITDISFYRSFHKEYFGEDVSNRKLRDLINMFIKEQPIFSNYDTVENLGNYSILEMEMENGTELDRQNAMDEMNFEEYCNFQGPWKCTEKIDDKINIIGFIIHKLLSAKYSEYSLTSPPSLPKLEVAVCVVNFTDLDYLQHLKKLLAARRIEIFQLQDTMDYCIERYKNECTYSDNLKEKSTDDINLKSDNPFKNSSMKLKGSNSLKEKISKNKLHSALSDGVLKGFENKFVQTPKLFPDKEFVFSEAGILGKACTEILNIGECPNEILNAKMILEYLKSFNDIHGWVLVNYPQTINEAAKLEEVLTRLPIPELYLNNVLEDGIKEIVDLEKRQPHENEDKDQILESKLVVKPRILREPKYDTYLTAFIELIRTDSENTSKKYFTSFILNNDDNTIGNFYRDQGCQYVLYYEEINFNTIKELGKLILGEFTIPPKTSIELFTDTVNYVEAELGISVKSDVVSKKTGEKKKHFTENQKNNNSSKNAVDEIKHKKDKSKSSKSKDTKKTTNTEKDKKGKKVSRISVQVAENLDKETQIPDETLSDVIELHNVEDIEVVDPKDNWFYINLPIPKKLEVILATLWENMEISYIKNLKQLFFRERVQIDQILPHYSYLLKNMVNYINRPDNKQDMLREFQICYNELNDDMRADSEVKVELNERIYEFKNTLWKICDQKMTENENERIILMNNNLISKTLCDITNICILMTQIEIDRCSDTIQLLSDYYHGIIFKTPCDVRPLEKTELGTIKITENLQKFESYVKNFLLTGEPALNQNSPIYDSINHNKVECFKYIKNCKLYGDKLLDKIKKVFNPKTKSKAIKKSKASKPNKDSSSKKSDQQLFELDSEVKLRANEILFESEQVMSSEITRVEMRIRCISSAILDTLTETLSIAEKFFKGLTLRIETKYFEEMGSVENACKVFTKAVEVESKIQKELLFDNDRLYANPYFLLFEDKVSTSIDRERLSVEHFSCIQLDKITDIFKKISPSGILSQQSFIFNLQHLITAEDEDDILVPKLWTELHPHLTLTFSKEIFGDSEFIDWRDFILYNLNIPFPNEFELLLTRKEFRKLDSDYTETIFKDQYNEVHFWFDDSVENKLKLKLIRNLLAKLYEFNDECINYSAMLLSFCKDLNPVIGFVKAIELALGKILYWDRETAKTLIREDLENKRIKEDTNLLCKQVILDLIDNSVHKSTSVYLEEIDIEPEVTESNNIISNQSENVTNLLINTINGVELKGGDSKNSIFTNPSQGFECANSKEYRLPFEVIITIMNAVLPRHFKIQTYRTSIIKQIALIYHSYVCPQENEVFAYKVMNNEDFQEIINKIYNFKIHDPCNIMKNLLKHEN